MLDRFFRNKKLKYIYMILMFSIIFVIASNKQYAYQQSTISDTFPEAYQSYIDKIKEEHPNWVLKAFYTHLDWNAVLNAESSGTYSRIQNSAFGDAWKRIEAADSSEYNAAGFVLASRAAVAYTLDPRNFLNDEGIFQFRVIDQNIDSDTESAVNAITYKTPMHDAKIGEETYASVIQKVGVEKTIAPTFIVSRIRQETSCDIVNNGSINGKNSKYPGYYNFFNIGAVDGSGAVQAGINLAYSMGWNTQEKAIAGGMQWFKDKYLKYGQSTVYFQKFDVANPYGNAATLLKYQYMTNISAPQGEARITYNGLQRAETIDNVYTFYIPIYDNMPEIAAPVPTIGYYENDSTMVYLDDPTDNLSDTFKIRSSADSSNDSNIIYTLIEPSDVNKKTVITRTKKGVQTGWDYIEFEKDGKKIEGYIWSSYVYEHVYNKVETVTLNVSEKDITVGEGFSLEVTVNPSDAKFKDVEWSSSNNEVVTVDGNGKVTAVSAGSAVITVKSKDQGKTATCVVKVEEKKPSINFDNEKYSLVKDEKIDFKVLIENSEIKEYDIEIIDEKIAKVEDGKIVGLSAGETQIIVTLKGTEIKAQADIKVVQNNEEIVIDEDLIIEDNFITKINQGTKVSDIVDKITTNCSIEVKNLADEVMENDAVVGTGTKINIKDEKENIVVSYSIVVTGDVDGNGIVDSMDMYKTIQHILENAKLANEFYRAGNTNSDSKIDSMDMYNIIQIILKK